MSTKEDIDEFASGQGAAQFQREHLDRVLDYVGKWVGAELITGLLSRPAVYDALRGQTTVEELSDLLPELSASQVNGFMRALAVEDIVTTRDGVLGLTEFGTSLAATRGWLELFTQGYRGVFHSVSDLLDGRGLASRRDFRSIGTASTAISEFDALPLINRAIDEHRPDATSVLDLGCADAQSLISLCSRRPRLRGVGVEPDPHLCAEATVQIARSTLSGQVELVNDSAQAFRSSHPFDVVVWAFVLHEVAGQVGVEGVTSYLRDLGDRFPNATFVAVEVDVAPWHDPVKMREDTHLRGYYNPYYLLHEFTGQKLLSFERWRDIFRQAGYVVIDELEVSEDVDATGAERAFILARRHGS